MRRHDLPIMSIMTFFKSALSVCARRKSNATSIGSRHRLCLLCIAVANYIGYLNSNAGSRELNFTRKIFYSCEKNCQAHSNHFECFHWFSEKKIEHRRQISSLKNKVWHIQVMRKVCYFETKAKFKSVSQLLIFWDAIFIKNLQRQQTFLRGKPNTECLIHPLMRRPE